MLEKYDDMHPFDFTIHRDDEINRVISQDLSYIRQVLSTAFEKEIISLALVGGFGRGEGSVLLRNHVYRPFNDYDIVMLTHRRVNSDKLATIRRKLARELSLICVDIDPMTCGELSHLPPTMFNYALKYGHYIFHGSDRWCESLPELNPDSIPLIDAKILLFNRASALLEATNYMSNRQSHDSDAAQQCAFFTSKAILACCEVFLLMRKGYHFKYQERAVRFSRICTNGANVDLVNKATAIKMDPQCNTVNDLAEFWYSAKDFFMQTLIECSGELYSTPFTTWSDFVKNYDHFPYDGCIKKQIKIVLFPIIKRRKMVIRQTQLAELLLLIAKDREGINDDYMHAAKELLHYKSNKNGIALWNGMKSYALKTWYELS